MFATIKSLIPEPRQADQPRRYVGRHRQPDELVTVPAPEGTPPAPAAPAPEQSDEPVVAHQVAAQQAPAQQAAAQPVAVESNA